MTESPATPPRTLSFEHNGHTVTLSADFTFVVTGDAFAGLGRYEDTFASAAEACRKIDDRVAAKTREKRVREKLSIEAIDDTGAPCIIRGINANTSALLGVPIDFDHRTRSVRNVLPPVPWLIAKVKHWRSLQKEVAKLERQIGKYRVLGSRGYGRIEAGAYDTAVAKLQREFAAALKRANDEAEADRD